MGADAGMTTGRAGRWEDAGVSRRRLPEPITPDPQDAPPLRWGILGAGGIAARMTTALHHGSTQTVVAVGSRAADRGAEFADRFGIESRVGYEALVDDDGIDAIYVASPHSEHREHALLAIAAGKHVLVEKAFARNEREARDVVDAARAAGVVCLEAMWSRFLPRYDVVRQAIAAGLLGELRLVEASHGQLLYPDGPQRLADPALAGGALLDLGVYPIHLAAMLMPTIESVRAAGALTPAGVDLQEVVTLVGGGAVASCSASMAARSGNAATISGTEARIKLDGWFYQPGSVRLVSHDDTVLDEWVQEPDPHGLRFEACEVARLAAAGETESALLPLDETLRVMRIMDEARAALGMVLPGE